MHPSLGRTIARWKQSYSFPASHSTRWITAINGAIPVTEYKGIWPDGKWWVINKIIKNPANPIYNSEFTRTELKTEWGYGNLSSTLLCIVEGTVTQSLPQQDQITTALLNKWPDWPEHWEFLGKSNTGFYYSSQSTFTWTWNHWGALRHLSGTLSPTLHRETVPNRSSARLEPPQVKPGHNIHRHKIAWASPAQCPTSAYAAQTYLLVPKTQLTQEHKISPAQGGLWC